MAFEFGFYYCFSRDLHNAQHKLFGTTGGGADVLGIAATAASPEVTHETLADISELAPVGGYSVMALANTGTVSDWTFTLTTTDPAPWVSTGGFGAAEFEYLVLHNTVNGRLIGRWGVPRSHMNTPASTWGVSFVNGVILSSGPRVG
jgi:hypothetical protein